MTQGLFAGAQPEHCRRAGWQAGHGASKSQVVIAYRQAQRAAEAAQAAES